jgi:superoxide reductase
LATKRDVYKCEVCGNIVEVLHGGEGDLVCCGENMKRMTPHAKAEEGKEKHVPVVEGADGGVKVKVGSNPHPMEEKHYIEWVEVIDGAHSCRRYLQPGENPEAFFKGFGPGVRAREYCNVHGLWEA